MIKNIYLSHYYYYYYFTIGCVFNRGRSGVPFFEKTRNVVVVYFLSIVGYKEYNGSNVRVDTVTIR